MESNEWAYERPLIDNINIGGDDVIETIHKGIEQ